MLQLSLKCLADTKSLSNVVARGVRGAGPKNAGLILALNGELGSGKTTFTATLALALGAQEPVSSPTFVLSHDYHCDDGLLLEHWDLYRLSALPRELREPPTKNSLRIVEWANKFPEMTEYVDLTLTLAIESAQGRSATLSCSPANSALERAIFMELQASGLPVRSER